MQKKFIVMNIINQHYSFLCTMCSFRSLSSFRCFPMHLRYASSKTKPHARCFFLSTKLDCALGRVESASRSSNLGHSGIDATELHRIAAGEGVHGRSGHDEAVACVVDRQHVDRVAVVGDFVALAAGS